jgi:glycosyltransferase involved in cell wall biosynthesis
MTSRATVVIPCYNEEKRLDRNAFRAFLESDADTSLILVNDGSRDGTAAILGEVRSIAPDRVTVLSLERNGGKAEAVRRGVVSAMERGDDLVGYWDADLATPLDAITQFAQVMGASRYLRPGRAT